MAKRGSSKATSIIQEDFVADMYDGRRSPSSGASVVDKGDVRTSKHLFECKVKGSSAFPLVKTPTIVQWMEKITKEAYEEGLEPILALRFYLPDSFLADTKGWVDLSVHLLEEDSENVISVSKV